MSSSICRYCGGEHRGQCEGDLRASLADAQRLADISEQSRVDAWQQVDRLRAQVEELEEASLCGSCAVGHVVEARDATIAEQARRIEALQAEFRLWTGGAASTGRIAQLEQALREVKSSLFDVSEVLDGRGKEKNAWKALAIAHTTIDDALEQAAPGEGVETDG